MITSGMQFPDFQLPNQDNKTRTLKDYAGRWLVLYVYPKDDTPGCTIQGKSFTAEKSQFEKLGATVVGISPDDVQSHKDFCNKFSFTIELLADPKAQLLKAAGVGQTEYKGTMYWNRTTFLIDPKGQVRKVYENVKPDGHEAVLLKDIQDFQSGKRVNAVPEGYNSLTPYLSIKGAAEAIEFYKKSFGAQEVLRMANDGKIMHAELQIGSSKFMLSDEFPDMGNKSPTTMGGSPVSLMIYVEDCDQVFKQALNAGATEVRPLKNQFYGDRSGAVKDPYGYIWHIATHVEDLTDAEMQ